MRLAAIFLLALPLMAQQPKSYIGTSNTWSPFNEDKAMHFFAGGLIGIAPYYASRRIGNNSPWWDSLFWALLAGAIKENYDKNHGGRREYADVAYTGFGGLMVGFALYRSDMKKMEYAGIPKNVFVNEPLAGGQ